jgi:hypothetical protein
MRDVRPHSALSGVALRALYVHGPEWLREVADAADGDSRGVALKLDVSTDPEGVALTEEGWTEVAEGRWRDPYTRQVLSVREALDRLTKDRGDAAAEETNP